jgi:hypothetical protein
MQKPSKTSGLWLVLQWKRKPKKLGTGFGWVPASKPTVFWMTWKAAELLEKNGLKVRVWPANVA